MTYNQYLQRFIGVKGQMNYPAGRNLLAPTLILFFPQFLFKF